MAQARYRGDWKKVVFDVKVTSTDKMNDAFKEKDENTERGRPVKRWRKSLESSDGALDYLT